MRPPARSAPVFAAIVIALAAPAAAAQTQVLDDFSDVDGWTAHPSDGVTLTISRGQGRQGGAMRLDFDFHGGGGYAIARRQLPMPLPENYEFAFHVRGDSPPNDLEFKLADPSGENVWWHVFRRYEFPDQWRRVRLKQRQIRFAWGPAGGGDLERLGSVEIVVTAATGGRGTVWIDDLTFTPREPVRPYTGRPDAAASASLPGHGPERVLDGDTATAWRAPGRAGTVLELDFGQPREYGGLVVDWIAGRHAASYAVELSSGTGWEEGYRVTGGDGGRDYIPLPEAESRRVRLRVLDGAPGELAVGEVGVLPLHATETRSALLHTIARSAPRGSFPRYLTDSVQAYWTVVGASGAADEALVGTSGAIEPRPGGFSVEPFVFAAGRLVTWADAEATQSLMDGYLPIPSVRWTGAAAALDITAWPVGGRDSSAVIARYRVTNPSADSIAATLYLAVRPIQVNPTWQFLNTPGGAARIGTLVWDGSAVRADGIRALVPLTTPAEFGATTFDGGGIVQHLRADSLPAADSVGDHFAAATGALAFPVPLAPGETRDVYVAFPFSPDAPLPRDADPEASLAAAARGWHAELDRVRFMVPDTARPIVETLRSTLAYILVNRDGAAIQPGSRSYARSWIRDGALTAAALLRLGHADDARAFVEWFAPFQYPSGKVPCCVDARGADPVPENDSHGELIYIIAETFRFTADTAFLQRMWPHVAGAVNFIDSLRQSRRTPAYRTGDSLRFYGLLPESISHEGYSAKPMHSYWDDFFALRGLKDAADLAAVLGRGREARRYARMRDEFRRDLYRSLERTIAHHRIDYIPGSVELGDYDPTSTTIAVAPGGELANLPRPELERSFERYYAAAVARRDSTAWDAYTPYELRTVGTLVRLGYPARAHHLLGELMRDRRPAAWNHWAEVVWRDPATPRFIGDMPHTWVGSDFIRSVLDFFAYEREADSSLVVGAGIPRTWAEAEGGVAVDGLRTPYGALGFSVARQGGRTTVRLDGALRVPPGGIRVIEPFGGDGTGRRERVVWRVPAEVTF